MVSSRETFVTDAITAGHVARVFWSPDTMDGGLVALKVRETLAGGRTYLTQDITDTGGGDDTGVYVVP